MANDVNNHIVARGPVVLAVTAALLVLSTAFVVLRLISRFGIVRKPGWDDYTMILAWILTFGTSFSICYGTSYGLGRHESDVPDAWDPILKRSEYTFSVLYNPALMATKTSILIFYLTLSKTHKVFRWSTITTLIVVNVGGLALTLLNLLQCRPVSAAFESPVPATASCTDIVTLYLSSAPLNIITDLAILFLPMPILTSMRLPKKQKIILIITFGFGVFVAVVDVVRIAYLQSAARTHLRDVQEHKDSSGNASRNEANDFSWYASLSFLWSAIEINVGVMCACVPALKPLVSRFIPTWIHDATMREKSYTSDSIAVHPDFAPRSNSSQEPTVPRPVPAALHGEGEPIGMMDFLTTPETNDMSNLDETATIPTVATFNTNRRSTTFFDFVDVERRKNITLISNRESLYPVLMVTVLFFIWGFAYGLLDTLNAQFQVVADMSSGQTVGQHSAYYLGYIIGPLTFGRLIFRHWGFKACYTVGLIIYACGTLVFWPSAVLTSFPAFLVSNFIVGLGLSTLEVSANPFIALCGPPEYAEVRLNLSQGIQAIGSVVSPLLAKKVLFKASAGSLIDVQWTYLGISFFTVMLAIGYYYVPLPEATEEEVEAASDRMPIPRDATFQSTSIKVIWITLGLGVFSQFCYVGGQEAAATSFQDFTKYVLPSLDSIGHQALGHSAFAISRFVAAFINIWVKPRYLLLFFYIGSIAFAATCLNGSGATPAALIVMLLFFEGPIFSLIYVQSLRGLGKHTKDAAVLLTAATGGGGVFPPMLYGAEKARNVQYAYCVVVAAFSFGMIFAFWLNGYPTARQLADPVRDEQARRDDQTEQERNNSSTTMQGKRHKWWSDGIKRRWPGRREKDQLPFVEHRERGSVGEGTVKESEKNNSSPSRDGS